MTRARTCRTSNAIFYCLASWGLGRGVEAYAHLFGRPDGDRVLIAWTKHARARLHFPDMDLSGVVEFGLDGSSREIERPAEVELVPGEPRILRLKK
jgi:hypothetical protein